MSILAVLALLVAHGLAWLFAHFFELSTWSWLLGPATFVTSVWGYHVIQPHRARQFMIIFFVMIAHQVFAMTFPFPGEAHTKSWMQDTAVFLFFCGAFWMLWCDKPAGSAKPRRVERDVMMMMEDTKED